MMGQLVGAVVGGLLCLMMGTGAQQLDPIINMCVRFDHQSVVKNNTLYIDGGRETFIDVTTASDGSAKREGTITGGLSKNPLQQAVSKGNVFTRADDYLITIDLTHSWDWKTNISENALTKTKVPQTGTIPPIVSRGALYHGADADDNIYLWGGTTSFYNTSFPGFRPPYPAQYSLWSYNTVSQVWDQYDLTSGSPNRPSSGSFAEAPDQGLGFYFNGQQDSGSSSQTKDLGDEGKVFMQGMIVVDTNNQTARNLSTDVVVGDMPRSRGRMQYVEELGGRGILVQIGGNQKDVGNINNSYIGDLVPMDQIDIFDISSLYTPSTTPNGAWYKQSTSNTPPAPRIDFCLTLASASDGSSHNIYLYGGRGSTLPNATTATSPTPTFYDDVWVLSLPSFTWTLLYQSTSPRYGHTCHRVGNRTLLTVGGAADTRYSELPCDWETKGVGVFDMSEVMWGSVYDANTQEYQVPQKVVGMIGGNGYGGATMLEPQEGFEQEGLANIFKTPWNAQGAVGEGGDDPSPTNTTTPNTTTTAGKGPADAGNATAGAPPPKQEVAKHTVAIAGGTVGSVAIFGIAAALLFYYRKAIRSWATGGDFFPFLEIGEGREKHLGAEMAAKEVCWELPGEGKPIEMWSPTEWERCKMKEKEGKAGRKNSRSTPIEILSPSESSTRTRVDSGRGSLNGSEAGRARTVEEMDRRSWREMLDRKPLPVPVPRVEVWSPSDSSRSGSRWSPSLPQQSSGSRGSGSRWSQSAASESSQMASARRYSPSPRHASQVGGSTSRWSSSQQSHGSGGSGGSGGSRWSPSQQSSGSGSGSGSRGSRPSPIEEQTWI